MYVYIFLLVTVDYMLKALDSAVNLDEAWRETWICMLSFPTQGLNLRSLRFLKYKENFML